jgi:hypothetical protein
MSDRATRLAQANRIANPPTFRVTVRPADPAAEIGRHITNAICELQDLARAVALMKDNLRTGYPLGPAMLAETGNLYAALVLETARIADDLIGATIRTGDDVLGVLTTGETKDSYGIVHDAVADNWSPLFTAFADRECDEGVSSRDDWTQRIVETLRAVQARRVTIAA